MSCTSDQCLALAREFNLSETTFPVPRGPDAYDVRIFTHGGEIPFAGHPTLGTAWVLRQAGHLNSTAVTQHCGAGDIPVAFDGGRVELSAGLRDALEPLPRDLVERLLEELGLSSVDLVVDQPVRIVGTGLNFVHLPVHQRSVRRSVPASRLFRRYDFEFSLLGDAQDPIEGINLYSVDEDGDVLQIRSRVFVPGLSIPEDPATGSAATGLGFVLRDHGLLAEGERFVITQGVEMGRPSTLYGRLADNLVHVSGDVHPVASGEVRIPDPSTGRSVGP